MRRLFQAYLRSDTRTAQFLRFATVGIKISVIDIGGVYLLPLFFGLNLYAARILSLSSALLVGYVLNRYFTFGGVRRGCFYRQMAGHLGVHLCGGALNFGIYSLIVRVGHDHLDRGPLLGLLPFFALWIGGLTGMTFNFFVSKNFVFRARPDDAAEDPPGGLFARARTEQEG